MPLARACVVYLLIVYSRKRAAFIKDCKNECDDTETKLDNVQSKDIACSFRQGCESSCRKYRDKLVLQVFSTKLASCDIHGNGDTTENKLFLEKNTTQNELF